jgi:hypothetical protein
MESNKKYRPSSYSEGYIDKFNHIDYNLKLLNVSTNYEQLESSMNSTQVSINSTEIISNNTDVSNNIEVKVNTPKNYLYFFYKRAITFTFHLLLIAFFEIIFFFNVIVKYEDTALYNISDSYINPIIEYCESLNQTNKIVFFDIFNYLFNTTMINSIGNQDYNTRTTFNNNIIILSWIYVIIIFILFCFLIFLNIFIFKIKINYKKILIDNFFMIIILGLYEYMFFNTIIVKYKNIDNFTLNQYLINKVNTCS